MKKKFLRMALNIIKKDNPSISDIELDEYRYGLEGIYLTLQKTIIIFPIALFLGIFKNLVIILIAFNLIRKYACGMHASNSLSCLVASSFLFLCAAYIGEVIEIPILLKFFLICICLVCIFIYAPADTKKAPIIKLEKRLVKKRKAFVSTLLLSILVLFIDSNFYSNLILFGIMIEVVLILPITYHMFNHSYNNYKTYGLDF